MISMFVERFRLALVPVFNNSDVNNGIKNACFLCLIWVLKRLHLGQAVHGLVQRFIQQTHLTMYKHTQMFPARERKTSDCWSFFSDRGYGDLSHRLLHSWWLRSGGSLPRGSGPRGRRRGGEYRGGSYQVSTRFS